MANSNNSVITGKLRGILGKEIVFRDWEGKTIVAKAPKARLGDPSPAQEQTQERFLLASRYAKGVMDGKDQGIRDAYYRCAETQTKPVYPRIAGFHVFTGCQKFRHRSVYWRKRESDHGSRRG